MMGSFLFAKVRKTIQLRLYKTFKLIVEDTISSLIMTQVNENFYLIWT
ncbi:MAG: hypothetical protein PHD05_10045 [Sphaerochaetaceae bacterium]|nr:hypothetical protein [Sphaerochaetaceae bacterium]